MKKFRSLGSSLTKQEQKLIIGGFAYPGGDNMCNVYCGKGAAGEGKCAGDCKYCDDAGNGAGSGAGQDKMCSSSIG